MTGQENVSVWFTCRWAHKRAWETKRDAKLAARRTGPGLSAYRCKKCGGYHVGHSTAEWRAQHREARVS